MFLEGPGLFGSVEGHVAGCCEQGIELSFYVKYCLFWLEIHKEFGRGNLKERDNSVDLIIEGR
jgi:hypothetical protein